MAKRSRPTFKKRQKEIARQVRRSDKMSRRLEKRDQKAAEPPVIGDDDREIAGIMPGPQPLPEEWDYVGQNPRPVPPPDKKEESN